MRFHLRPRGCSFLVATFASLALASGAAAAADSGPINVTIDFAKVVHVDEPADTVIVGNPGIADANIDDNKTLVLTGHTAGTTNLIVLNAAGDELLNATVVVASDIRQLTTVFRGASRQTFSCEPTCEQVISVGDNADAFDTAKTQIETRRQFSTAQ